MVSWVEKIEQDQTLAKWFEDVAGLEPYFWSQALFLAMRVTQPLFFERDFLGVSATYAILKGFLQKSAGTLDDLFNVVAGEYPLIKDAMVTVEVSRSMLRDDEVQRWFKAATLINEGTSKRLQYYVHKIEHGGSISGEILDEARRQASGLGTIMGVQSTKLNDFFKPVDTPMSIDLGEDLENLEDTPMAVDEGPRRQGLRPQPKKKVVDEPKEISNKRSRRELAASPEREESTARGSDKDGQLPSVSSRQVGGPSSSKQDERVGSQKGGSKRRKVEKPVIGGQALSQTAKIPRKQDSKAAHLPSISRGTLWLEFQLTKKAQKQKQQPVTPEDSPPEHEAILAVPARVKLDFVARLERVRLDREVVLYRLANKIDGN